MRDRVDRTPYWLLGPLVVFLLVLVALPLLVDIVYALSDVTFETLRTPHLSGIGNFIAVLRDAAFWHAMLFSLKFACLSAVAQLCLGLGLALLLAPLLARFSWLMAPLMLPMMLAPALVGLMYRMVLQEFVGVVPYYADMLFGDAPAFLSARNAFPTLVTIEVLQWTPFALLLLYGSYRSVPDELRGAAALDGAKPWQRFWFVDLPIMAPTIAIAFFFRFIDSFRVFDNIYVLTGSGSGGSTTSISIYIYEAFFRRNDIGVAVAGSLLLLGMCFAVLMGIVGLMRRDRA